jgi:hypothetical protein
MEKSGIYIIMCKKCGAYYIRQSKRRIGRRLGNINEWSQNFGILNKPLLHKEPQNKGSPLA